MQSETETPIGKRYLCFEGKASSSSVERVKPGLPPVLPCHTVILFASFAYADLPFTKRFDVVFPKGKPQDGIRCECKIIAATQQFGKPFSEIPHGWKTICAVHFPNGVPQLVQKLPEVDTWYQSNDCLCICDETTWLAITQN